MNLISMWHLSDPSYITGPNPAGWNPVYGSNPDIFLTNAMPVVKALKSKFLVIWDVEGSSLGAPLQYVGDPEIAEQQNPTFNYKNFFKNVEKDVPNYGHTIRATNIINDSHVIDDFYFLNYERKIKHSRSKWGCNTFYFDSNIRSGIPNVPNNWVESLLIPATTFARLKDRFPDCYFIPEHKDVAYHEFSDVVWPYRTAPTEWSTPAYVLRDIPKARSAISLNGIADGQVAANKNFIKASNDNFMLNAWTFYSLVNEWIANII